MVDEDPAAVVLACTFFGAGFPPPAGLDLGCGGWKTEVLEREKVGEGEACVFEDGEELGTEAEVCGLQVGEGDIEGVG